MILRDDLHVVNDVEVDEDDVVSDDDHPHFQVVVVVFVYVHFDFVPSRCTTTRCWKRQ